MLSLPVISAKLSPFTLPFAACTAKGSFFIFPSWWEFVNSNNGDCALVFPTDIPAVGLAILDILLRAAGLVAIVSIIVAGVTYITAGGNPEKGASARKRIYNSLIGLAIVTIASVLVAFIGNRLGG